MKHSSLLSHVAEVAGDLIERELSDLDVLYDGYLPDPLMAPRKVAVKYSARGCCATTDPLAKNPEHDFLRIALRRTLQSGDACMEFLVQPRTSGNMDVEDSRIEWQEAPAPFYKIATIRIPQQTFDTPQQNTFCENLSFTPWHALPEHKPLGVTNRLRKVIYDRISRVRHEMNDAKREEP